MTRILYSTYLVYYYYSIYSMYFAAVRTTSVLFFNIGKHGWSLLLYTILTPSPYSKEEYWVLYLYHDRWRLKGPEVLFSTNINDLGRHKYGTIRLLLGWYFVKTKNWYLSSIFFRTPKFFEYLFLSFTYLYCPTLMKYLYFWKQREKQLFLGNIYYWP